MFLAKDIFIKPI